MHKKEGEKRGGRVPTYEIVTTYWIELEQNELYINHAPLLNLTQLNLHLLSNMNNFDRVHNVNRGT